MRPDATSRPPTQITTSTPTPAMSDMSGVKRAWIAATATLRSSSVRLAAANVAAARCSIVYARMAAMPASVSCTRPDSVPSCSCIACVRSLSETLKRRASSTRIGIGAIAHRVSQASTASIAARAPPKASAVLTRLTAPKPTRLRTAETSLEARVMRSPVE